MRLEQEIQEKNMLKDQNKLLNQDLILQKQRCYDLRKKLEEAKEDNRNMKERMIHETKIRAGIHCTKYDCYF